MKLRGFRPLNGWRSFAGEVGVVVLGVFIALSAQQVVESINERREAAATRAALVHEIEESLAVLQLRRTAEPCVDRRLKEVRAIVDQWGRTGTFKTPSWVGQAPWFVMNNMRVDAAVSAGRFPLLSNEEQYRFGLIAGSIQNFRQLQEREIDAWAKLRMLQSGPEALSAGDRTAVRLALQDASALNVRAKITTEQALPFAASYGWHPDLRRLRQMLPRAWRNGKFSPSICLGIDTPPEVGNRNMFVPVPE